MATTLTHPLYQSPQREANEYKYGTMADNQCICCMKPMKDGEVLRVHMNTDWEAVHIGRRLFAMFGHQAYKINRDSIEKDVREASSTATSYSKI